MTSRERAKETWQLVEQLQGLSLGNMFSAMATKTIETTIEKAIADAVAEEREACAKFCEDHAEFIRKHGRDRERMSLCLAIAAAIRARQ